MIGTFYPAFTRGLNIRLPKQTGLGAENHIELEELDLP
jgi:hypothetical protein